LAVVFPNAGGGREELAVGLAPVVMLGYGDV